MQLAFAVFRKQSLLWDASVTVASKFESKTCFSCSFWKDLPFSIIMKRIAKGTHLIIKCKLLGSKCISSQVTFEIENDKVYLTYERFWKIYEGFKKKRVRHLRFININFCICFWKCESKYETLYSYDFFISNRRSFL